MPIIVEKDIKIKMSITYILSVTICNMQTGGVSSTAINSSTSTSTGASTTTDGGVTVTVTAPSRLHFSLIDLNGGLGRVDGGIGVALLEPSLKIKVSHADSETEKENPEEVTTVLERIRRGIPELRHHHYKVEILRALPHHVGLGSRTQLALSVARAISVLEGSARALNTFELAKLVGRGGTSGIGTAAFDCGGFILDGGHPFRRDMRADESDAVRVKHSFLPSSASKVPPPPVLFQHPLPDDWFFVLAIPRVKRGAHGDEEVDIFKRNCPIAPTEVEKICRLVLMRILPSVIERDIYTFGESLSMIQQLGFKRLEVELQHSIIKSLFEFFDAHALGYGMSSFGPTTYGVVRGEKNARELAQLASRFLAERHVPASVYYSSVNNHGATVELK